MTLAVKIKKLYEDAKLPEYAHGQYDDAGMDLYAREDATLKAGITIAVPTGIAIELPHGHEGQVRSRSGLALKHGVFVVNAPGTIDPTYRGEVCALLSVMKGTYKIKKGDKIAQLVIANYVGVQWTISKELAATDRGDGGFGSTGR